jgi:hypothetical protein
VFLLTKKLIAMIIMVAVDGELIPLGTIRMPGCKNSATGIGDFGEKFFFLTFLFDILLKKV